MSTAPSAATAGRAIGRASPPSPPAGADGDRPASPPEAPAERAADQRMRSVHAGVEPPQFALEFLFQSGGQCRPGIHARRHDPAQHRPAGPADEALPGRHAVEEHVGHARTAMMQRHAVEILAQQRRDSVLEPVLQCGIAARQPQMIEDPAAALDDTPARHDQDGQRRSRRHPPRQRYVDPRRQPHLVIVDARMIGSGRRAASRRAHPVKPCGCYAAATAADQAPARISPSPRPPRRAPAPPARGAGRRARSP